MTLLLFWNHASTDCRDVLLDLRRLYRKADKKKLAFISIISQQPEKVIQFLRRKKIQMTACGCDQAEIAFESYEAEETPVFYVIDDQCHLLNIWIGYNEDTMQKLKKLMWTYRKIENCAQKIV